MWGHQQSRLERAGSRISVLCQPLRIGEEITVWGSRTRESSDRSLTTSATDNRYTADGTALGVRVAHAVELKWAIADWPKGPALESPGQRPG